MSQNIVLTKTLALLFCVLKGEAHHMVGILKRRIKSSYYSMLLLLYKGQGSYHLGEMIFLSICHPIFLLLFSATVSRGVLPVSSLYTP